ncbi:hypothetical protein J2D73_17160 [Acetobacter sacchari]|uniref:HTH cro/C1-type domain-containing protein n=1 Tax=Acetobacter sacchari TaxID=2661687 RepID=A0ABS3M025_9PROT|nr:hypothetical protein [Acetobacter sacchari]MBO1361517.1 hypothetical protein [Acetobacter sacchari]
MTEELIHPKDFYRKLNTAIRAAGGVTAFARAHGVSPRKVYDAQDGARYHEEVARALGLAVTVRYPVIADPKTLVAGKVVYEKLNSFIRASKSQRAAAEELGVSVSHLSNIVNARRGLAPVLAHLGFMAPLTRFAPLARPVKDA